ncbi:hypothetical protein SKAU_G00180550 [Synaphobranchus kaupii]|uniref:Uncharacterized protein n=1 Tax=Synaphobranchus kaupii TaxID=118154 RepID=A0A9Q1J1M4_SYNKA|nr:hypothetical protein SKAU_G00180550 [Synaphobranchus kaupii]
MKKFEVAKSAGSGEENENLRSELEKLECHFTWGLTAKDADLNFLEVKFREVVSLPEDSLPQEINLKGRTYNHLAYVKHLQGCNQEALGYLGKAVEENADNAKSCIVTYGNLAWVHHLMGDDREAETYLRRLEEINESFPTPPPAALHREVFGEKAWSLLKFSKYHYEEAKDCFYEALQREPDDKEWNTGYALSLFRWDGWRIMTGEKIPLSTSRSVKQLERALELDPDNGVIMVYLARVFQNNGKKLVAWNHMRKALEVSPNNLSVVLKVGKFLRNVHSYDMALDVLNKMLKIAPDSARLHHEIANNYRWKAIIGKGHLRNPELIRRSISHKKEEVRLNPSYFYPPTGVGDEVRRGSGSGQGRAHVPGNVRSSRPEARRPTGSASHVRRLPEVPHGLHENRCDPLHGRDEAAEHIARLGKVSEEAAPNHQISGDFHAF